MQSTPSSCRTCSGHACASIKTVRVGRKREVKSTYIHPDTENNHRYNNTQAWLLSCHANDMVPHSLESRKHIGNDISLLQNSLALEFAPCLEFVKVDLESSCLLATKTGPYVHVIVITPTGSELAPIPKQK